MPKPDGTNSTEYFNALKVKKVKPGDRIPIGFRSATVVENKKLSTTRMLTLKQYGPTGQALVTLTVPKDWTVRVTRTSKTTKK